MSERALWQDHDDALGLNQLERGRPLTLEEIRYHRANAQTPIRHATADVTMEALDLVLNSLDEARLILDASAEAFAVGSAWIAAEKAIRPGVVRAISIGQYPEGYEGAGHWTALLVYDPRYYGNGPTPAAALGALAAGLEFENPPAREP